jgi:hypothetical protein
MPSNSPQVSPVDQLALHFRKINERLATLERAASSAGGGGADVIEGTTPPGSLPAGSFFFDTDCEPPSTDWQAQINALDARLDVLELGKTVQVTAINYSALTTSAATETASFGTMSLPARSVPGLTVVHGCMNGVGTVTGDIFNMNVYNGVTVVRVARVVVPSTTNQTSLFPFNVAIVTPASTAVSITTTLVRVSGTGTMTVQAGSATTLWIPT